ncbi:hypothetical protein CKK33_10980 [Mucilaginibacter sp. MD40]|uniref:beta strand repeat-containing protein n=1 Tax=Mucilaginibacter sp. MD40 TaxID=2029590 RepID=UPI000BAC677A|nr:cadherin-like beta sandwich domain-containing protein [Mucilaginibacter sp. MD40]PAW93990.1 hypothetical protein CKK33_10980 [Mucilaginibacter sp. MD40]
MIKTLLLKKSTLTNSIRSIKIVGLLVMLICTASRGYAQVYYVLNSGTGNTTNAVNALKRIDYNGSNETTVTSSIPNPVLVEVDAPNNRIFTYNGFLGSRTINVVDMTSGSVINQISLPSAINTTGYSVGAIKYDPINNWVYYTTNTGKGTADAMNAIYRSKPDGSQNAALATSVALFPVYLALDIPNNRVFIYEGIFSGRKFLTFDLNSNTVTGNAPVSNIVTAMAYDKLSDNIYYTTSDNNPAATTDNDALRKIKPGGSGGEVVVKASLFKSPQYLALDAGNNRAFVYEGYIGSSTTIRLDDTGIFSVDLSSGSTTQILNHVNLQNTPTYYRVNGIYAAAAPVLSTTTATSITSAAATIAGSVTRSDGAVTEKGILYSTSNSTPLLNANGVTKATNGTGTGNISVNLTGLNSNTTYYARTYAISAAGTTYGNVINFNTLASNNASLTNYTISSGTLDPAFSSNTTSYTVSVPNSVTAITFTPALPTGASAKVNNTPTGGAGQPASASISLSTGLNVVTTVVTAQDGTTTQTYAINVTRAKADQTLSFSGFPAKSYGDADFVSGFTASSGLPVTYTSSNPAVVTIVNNQFHITGAGSTNITAYQAGDANTNAVTSAAQTLTVSPKAITLTADGKSKVYGATDPALTYTTTGLITGDALTGSLSRDAGENAGNYTINQGTLNNTNNPNYNISYTGNSLTIVKKDIDITIDTVTKVYGDADPAFVYHLNTPLLFTGDKIVGSPARNAGESVGFYNISKGTLAIANDSYTVDQNNYNFIIHANVLQITPATLNVNADNKSKTFNHPNPPLTYQISGFKNGDTEAVFSTPVSISTNATDSSPVGTYEIFIGNAVDPNYTFNYTNGTLTINPPPNNANLASISTDVGTLTPAFNQDSTNYTVSVADGVNQINITPTLSDTRASVQVNYIPATSGTSSAVAIYPGDNMIPVQVTAQDGTTTKVYNINVKAPLDKNANLSSVNFYDGETPVPSSYNAQTHNYSVAVPYQTNYIKIVPQTASANAIVTINNIPYQGVYGTALQPGANIFNVVVYAQDRAYQQTYTITVNRALSSNNNLATLVINQTNLVPLFNPAVTSYTASVAGSTSSVDISASTADTTAGLTINNQPIANNVIKNITLIGGDNIVTIRATAANGDTKDYTITINRAQSTDATLSNLTTDGGSLSPAFSPSVTAYTQTVAITKTSINITPTANAATSLITVNGTGVTSGNPINLPLNYGLNTSTIVVTAESGATQTYTISTTRPEPSANSNLASIVVTPSSILTQTIPGSYVTSVSSSTSSIKLTLNTADPNASIKVNGVSLANGILSDPIALSSNSTLITIVTTAQNGTAKRTYQITVNKTGSSNAEVTDIKLTPSSALSLISKDNYNTSVSSSISSVKLTLTAADDNASLKVNGMAVTSGTISDPIALTGASTVLNIVSTAEDGTTTRNYSVTVNKTGSSDANIASLNITPAAVLLKTSAGNYQANVSTLVNSVKVTALPVSPSATVKVNGTVVANGSSSNDIPLNGYATLINIVTTAEDGVTTRTFTITVIKTGSNITSLANISLTPASMLTLSSNSSFVTNYTSSVANNVDSIKIAATLTDPNGSLKVNGTPISSGALSNALGFVNNSAYIAIEVTAEDGSTTHTYTITVNKRGSSNANISDLVMVPGVTLTQTFPGNYSASVNSSLNSVQLKAKTEDANATIQINGNPVISGVITDPIALTGSSTVLNIISTAQDGITKRTYAITVNKNGSSNANMSSLAVNPTGTLTLVSAGNYSTTAAPAQASVQVAAIPSDSNASITINGIATANGVPSAPIALNATSTLLSIVVTAEDGITTRTFTITVNKAPNTLMATRQEIRMLAPKTAASFAPADVVVHPAVSPNGDGSNDFLTIEGLSDVSGSKLSIMNAAGNLVYETKNYGKNGNVFDGHDRGGSMLRSGTYYYALEYTTGNETKRKTGYLVLKY